MKRCWILLLGICGLLQSCLINGHEDVVLYADGSGVVSVNYTFPRMAVSADRIEQLPDDLEKCCAEVDGVRAEQVMVEARGGVWKLSIKVSFESADALHGLYLLSQRLAVDGSEEMAILSMAVGKISAGFNNQEEFGYQRKFGFAALIPDQVKQNPVLLGNSAVSVKITLPIASHTSNALKTGAEGREMYWKFRLRDYLDKPMETSFGVVMPEVDVFEVFQLNRDGSGSLSLKCPLPLAVCGEQQLDQFEKELRGMLGRYRGVELRRFHHGLKGIFHHLEMVVDFSSVLTLQKMLASEEMLNSSERGWAALVGDIEISREWHEVTVMRSLSMSEFLLRYAFGEPQLLQNARVHYEVRLPYACVDSDATEVSEDGSTLRWEYPLASANSIEMQYTVALKFPWWVWGTVVMALTGGAYLLLRWWRRREGQVEHATIEAKG